MKDDGMENDVDSFMDEEFLRRLENLKVLAHRGIRGGERGEHTSWRSGPSLEFLDYRKYQMGDDFRYIDWNVFGRLDKLFIKLFRAEENQRIHVLFDKSASMGIGEPSKAMYAKKITAAICYICLANLDNVYITAFSDHLDESLSPVKNRLAYSKILKFLLRIKPGGGTDFNTSLATYAAINKHPGISVVISDLMDANGYEDGLEALKHRRFDTTVIQILDHEERFPSKTGNLKLKEIEAGDIKTITVDRTILRRYREAFQDFITHLSQYCSRNSIDYYLCDTTIPFEDLFLQYLTAGRLFR